MAVPKKRTGHSAQGKRRSNWKATKPTLTTCPNCGQAVLAHTVCTACGTYKGKPVSIKDRVEEVKEEKKAKRTSSKKAKKEEKDLTEFNEALKTGNETVEEAKVEEAKAEEVKTEEASEDKAE